MSSRKNFKLGSNCLAGIQLAFETRLADHAAAGFAADDRAVEWRENDHFGLFGIKLVENITFDLRYFGARHSGHLADLSPGKCLFQQQFPNPVSLLFWQLESHVDLSSLNRVDVTPDHGKNHLELGFWVGFDAALSGDDLA